MRRAGFLYMIGALFVAAVVRAGNNDKGEGRHHHQKPFQRLARTLQSSAADEVNGADQEEEQVHDFFLNGGFQTMKDYISGNMKNTDVFRKMTTLVDLEQAWQDPTYLKHVVAAAPMVKSIKGVGEILSQDTVSPADVSVIVMGAARIIMILSRWRGEGY